MTAFSEESTGAERRESDTAEAPCDDRLTPLTKAEVSALAAAGAWYANYHAHSISRQLGDESAAAVARRERYSDLLAGLRKLGAVVYDPTESYSAE